LTWTHAVDQDWWGSSALSCKEVQDKIAGASASTIIGLYSHHGKCASKNSVSIRFQCEHGRGRTDGGEKSREKSLSKDLATVNVHAAGSRYVENKKPAPAHTNMRRSKFSNCQYGFTLTTSDLNELSPPDAKGIWRLSTHHKSDACNVHSGHPKPAFSAGRIMGATAEMVENMGTCGAGISSIIDAVLQNKKQALTRHQINHFLKQKGALAGQKYKKSVTSAGGCAQFLLYLAQLDGISYRMLVQNVSTNAMYVCDEFAMAEECADEYIEGIRDAKDAAGVRRQGLLWDETIDYDAPVPPGTVFAYKKIRHVMFKQCDDDASKCHASCTCGFMKQHGVCCRHVLAVLLIILRDKRIGQDSLWDGFDLKQCFNMNLVSKHKYHAAVFSSDRFL